MHREGSGPALIRPKHLRDLRSFETLGPLGSYPFSDPNGLPVNLILHAHSSKNHSVRADSPNGLISYALPAV